MRRLLLTPDGKPKAVLRDGERKSITTERVTFTLGSGAEVRTVRKIYSLFLDADLNCSAIARWPNAKRVPYGRGEWHYQIVKTILSHPRYTGSLVYGRTSERLRSKSKPNPREQWIIQPNSFPAIITQQRFDAAQHKLNDRVHLRSNEKLLEELAEFVNRYGHVTNKMLASDPKMANSQTYGERFGSFSRAIALVVKEPKSGFSQREYRARLKLHLQDEFAGAMAALNIGSHRMRGVFRSSAHPPVLLDVARCCVLKNGELRWEIRYPLSGIAGLCGITLRLSEKNRQPLDYSLFRSLPPGNQRYRFSKERIQRQASVCKDLDEAVNLLLQGETALLAPKREGGLDVLDMSGIR